MCRRVFAAITAVTIVLSVLFLVPGPAAGQIFWPKDTPKIPQARTWLQQKAKLPPYSPPRTPDGVPDLQGNWGSAVRGGNDDIEEHDWVDVTTPAQESFVFDPPDKKIPYTPWGLAKRNEIRGGLGRGWPGETGERLYADPESFCLRGIPRNAFDGQEIIQKPGYVIMLAPNFYRVIPTDGRPHISQSEILAREFAWPLGRRYAGCRGDWSQRQTVVRQRRELLQREYASRGTLEVGRREYDRLRGDDRGSHDLYQTLEDDLPAEACGD